MCICQNTRESMMSVMMSYALNLFCEVIADICDVSLTLWCHPYVVMSSLTVIFNCSHSYSYGKHYFRVFYSIDTGILWQTPPRWMLLVPIAEILWTLLLHPPLLIPVVRGSEQGRFGVFDSVLPNRASTLIRWVCLMHQMGASAGVVTVQLMLLGLYMRDKRCHCYMT